LLLSVGLDADGEFEVRSANSRSGVVVWSWQVPSLVSALQPHASPAADDATPFDLKLNADTIVVFRLEPGACSFESAVDKALFLKSRADGSTYPHNPFSSAWLVGGNPRLFAARCHAPQYLAGCAYAYNLGVVVKQGGKRTPLAIDLKITNSAGN
jgi:hypothetical protein